MRNVFKEAQLIIFDLDGTLYEDTSMFNHYAHELMLELDEDKKTAFRNEYQKILTGEHILSIGKVYDVERDLVLGVNPITLKVKEAWTWEGEKLPSIEVKHAYPSPILLDFHNMIAIGDGWWLPNACAKHFGVIDTYSAYERTKDFMASDSFELKPIPNLKNALLHLTSRKQCIVLTNSQYEDAIRILDMLELSDLFIDVLSGANKPSQTVSYFKKLIGNYDLSPEQCLSIGDNFINEIAPAIQLGMKTIFIDYYKQDYPEYDGIKVKSLAETIDLMTLA